MGHRFYEYGAIDFPAMNTFNNFYVSLHDQVDIPLRIEILDNSSLFTWFSFGSISLLIENIIGFYDINASNNIVKWNLGKKSKQGIDNLQFGKVIISIIYENN